MKIFLSLIFLIISQVIIKSQESLLAIAPHADNNLNLSEEKAFSLFKKGRYAEALPAILSLLKTSPDSYEYNYKAGICYFNSEDEQSKGIEYLKKCIPSMRDIQGKDEASYYLARLYMMVGKPDSAILSLAEYTYNTVLPEKDTKQLIIDCLNESKTRLSSDFRLFDKLNSDYADNYPLMVNDTSIFFASKRPTEYSHKSSVPDYNIFFVHKDSLGNWKDPVYFEYNSKFNEYPCFVSPSGDTMYFASNRKENFDIYQTFRVNNKWTKPVLLSEPLNSAADETGFTVGRNQNMVIISSNRKQSKQGFDLFAFKKTKKGKWVQTKTLKLINPSGNQISPSLGFDGSVLFFSTEKSHTGENYDIFMSRLSKDKKWGQAFNIGNLFNSLKNEVWYNSQPDLKTTFLVSYSPYRNYDIWINRHNLEELKSDSLKIKLQEDSIKASLSQVFNAVNTANRIESMDTEKAIDEIETLTSSQANSVIDILSDNKVSSILENIDNNKAIELVDGMNIDKALDVVEKLEIKNAVNILESIDQYKAADILQSLSIEKSTDFIKSMDKDKASDLVQVMDPVSASNLLTSLSENKVNEIVENIDADNVAEIIEGMDIEKAVNMMNEMDEEKTIDVLENLSDSVASAIVKGMEKNIDESENLQKDMNVLNSYYNSEIANNRQYVFKTIYFDFGSSELLLLSKNELLILIDFLKNNQEVMAEIIGHTDNIGDWDYNLNLSNQRAKVVYDFLLKNKISHKRIIFYGKGNADPIVSNDTQLGRDKNRRVELVLLNYKQK